MRESGVVNSVLEKFILEIASAKYLAIYKRIGVVLLGVFQP